MNWLREICTDSKAKILSSRRAAMLLGAFSLSVAVVILAVAGLCGSDVSAAMWAVSVPLAGLGGYSYVQGTRAVLKDGRNNEGGSHA